PGPTHLRHMQDHVVSWRIVDHHHAVSVEDPSAHRAEAYTSYALAFDGLYVVGTMADLDSPQQRNEEGESSNEGKPHQLETGIDRVFGVGITHASGWRHHVGGL
ncbi:MAG: hypothetical protein HON70_45885, partial [Lentisphaerae bacterium]|nr:hypothetical protein [Lentisphaerota bacterium]